VGQVPSDTPYLLIGNGRLSRHLQRYLSLESIRFALWQRSSGLALEPLLERARAVVVLIADDALEGFLERWAHPGQPLWIHCSGSLTTPLAEGAHPLMLFGDEPYDRATYRRVPFVCERGRRQFPELFPELGNPHVAIDPALKPLYHAVIAMAGNFTTLLWQKLFATAGDRLGVDRRLLYPYLEQVVHNLERSPSPLTGPLARGDCRTVERHLEALADDPFREVYRAFVEAYRCDPAVRRT
jgi:predicted short-subunit dehydrogenase-like oxidoreductase (DUF2520 family)